MVKSMWAGILGAALAAQAGAAEAEPPKPPSELEASARERNEAQAARLRDLAREAFKAGDYASARRLALAVNELLPGDPEAGEIHRLSLEYGRRTDDAQRDVRVSGPETVEQAIERLSGSRTIPWAKAPPSAPKREEAAVEPPKAEWEARIERKLAEKGTMSFKGTPFSDVQAYLEALLGCPIVIDRRYRQDVLALPVRFEAKDMPLEQALTWIVKNDLGLRYALADGAVYISDAKGIERKVGVARVYDVEDLIYLSEMPDFEGPSFDALDPAGKDSGIVIDRDRDGAAPRRPRGISGERLARMIRQSVDPDDWTGEDD